MKRGISLGTAGPRARRRTLVRALCSLSLVHCTVGNVLADNVLKTLVMGGTVYGGKRALDSARSLRDHQEGLTGAVINDSGAGVGQGGLRVRVSTSGVSVSGGGVSVSVGRGGIRGSGGGFSGSLSSSGTVNVGGNIGGTSVSASSNGNVSASGGGFSGSLSSSGTVKVGGNIGGTSVSASSNGNVSASGGGFSGSLSSSGSASIGMDTAVLSSRRGSQNDDGDGDEPVPEEDVQPDRKRRTIDTADGEVQVTVLAPGD